jgi:hypothetical protein
VLIVASTGELQGAPLAQQLGVGVHFAMCRHCRAFRRQLAAIGDAARALRAAFSAEPGSRFEADVIQRLLT